MGTIDVIDGIIQIETNDDGVFVRLGPVLNGEAPTFEMRDESLLDSIKKFFLFKDYRVYHEKVDKRFFITDYPSPFYSLPKETAALIAALPVGATVTSDGRFITLRLLPGASDDDAHRTIETMKAIAAHAQRKLALFDGLPEAKKQARVSWDQCPEPMYTINSWTATIDIYVRWGGPHVALKTPNVLSLPGGILSVKDKAFVPRSDKERGLLKEVEKAGGQEFAAVLNYAASFYSSMNDNNLSVNIFTEPSIEKIRASIELLTRLATPKGGPFR